MFINMDAAIGLAKANSIIDSNNIYWIWPNEEQADLRNAVLGTLKALEKDQSADSSKIALLIASAGAMIHNQDPSVMYLIYRYWYAEKGNGHSSHLMSLAKENMLRVAAKMTKEKGGKVYVFRDEDTYYDDPFKYLIVCELFDGLANVFAGMHIHAVFAKSLIDEGIAVFDQSKASMKHDAFKSLLVTLDRENYLKIDTLSDRLIVDNSSRGIQGIGILDTVTAFRPSIKPVSIPEYESYVNWLWAKTQTQWSRRTDIRASVAASMRQNNPLNDPERYNRQTQINPRTPKRTLFMSSGIPGKVIESSQSAKNFLRIPSDLRDEYVTIPRDTANILSEFEYDVAWWSAQPALPAPFDANPYPAAAQITPRLNGFGEMERQRRKRLKKAGLSPRTAEQIYAGLVVHSVVNDALNG